MGLPLGFRSLLALVAVAALISHAQCATNDVDGPEDSSSAVVTATSVDGQEATTWTSTTTTSTTTRAPTLMERARELMANAMRSAEGSPLVKRLMLTDLSLDCTVGLLRFMRGVRNLEPWAVRLIDASGKYPTGLFQGTISDIGAYDECIETIVHDEFGHVQTSGQYCNVYIKMVNDTSFIDDMLPAFLMTNKRSPELFHLLEDDRVQGLRVGICTMSDCTKEDMQNIANTLAEGIAKVTVSDCVTGEPTPITTFQYAIMAIGAFNVLLVILSTAYDEYATKKNHQRTMVVKILCAFSVPRNTRLLLYVNRNKQSEAYCYRFLHGLRFISLFWIVLGHASMAFDPVVSRFANVLEATGSWFFCTFSTAFLSVDTFFYLSGFLLTFNVIKVDMSAWVIIVVALIRRFIRVTVPVAFCVLGFFLVPLFFSGPNSKLLYDNFYEEVNSRWWQWLLHVRNFYKSSNLESFSQLWYLSTDFQLFVVCIFILALLQKRQTWMKWTFVALSLLCSAFSAWQMQTGKYLPVIPSVVRNLNTMADTFNEVYMMPTFHGASYFLGCVTAILLQKYRKAEMSLVTEVVMWCASAACALTCILARHRWNSGTIDPGAWQDVAFAFFDRLLWSVFLGWLTIACARGRAGFIGTFLSWGAFVPLSRMSFGVYLVHLPYFVVMCFVSRERMYYSMLGVISATFSIFVWSCIMSYFVFILCECPNSVVEKNFLGFESLRAVVGKDSELPRYGVGNGDAHWPVANGKKAYPAGPTVIVTEEAHESADSNNCALTESKQNSCRL